jgi:hypothetical protein
VASSTAAKRTARVFAVAIAMPNAAQRSGSLVESYSVTADSQIESGHSTVKYTGNEHYCGAAIVLNGQVPRAIQ